MCKGQCIMRGPLMSCGPLTCKPKIKQEQSVVEDFAQENGDICNCSHEHVSKPSSLMKALLWLD